MKLQKGWKTNDTYNNLLLVDALSLFVIYFPKSLRKLFAMVYGVPNLCQSDECVLQLGFLNFFMGQHK